MRSLVIALLTLLISTSAAAQVVQPTYMRQAKSAQIQVFTAAQTATGAITSFDGSVIETTSFNGVQVALDFDPTCNGIMDVLSSLNKSGPFISNTAAPNSSLALTTFASVPTIYNVGNLGPFIKFRFNAFGCPTGLNASAILVPFPSNVIVNGDRSAPQYPVEIGAKYLDPASGRETVRPLESNFLGSLNVRVQSDPTQYAITSPATVSNVSATTLIAVNTLTSDGIVVVQNQGTVPIRCGIGNVVNVVTATDYEFSLKACTSAGDGTGGSQQLILGEALSLKCIAIGGAGSASVLTF